MKFESHDERPVPEPAGEMERDYVITIAPGQFKVLRLDLHARAVGSAWIHGEPRRALHPPTDAGVRDAFAEARVYGEGDLAAMGHTARRARPLHTLHLVVERVVDAVHQLGPPHTDTYRGRRWRYERVLDGPLKPAGRIVGADGRSRRFGMGTVEYARLLGPDDAQVPELVLLGEVVGGQLAGPVAEAVATAREAAQTLLARHPGLNDRLRITQVCRAFADDMDPRKLRDLVRDAVELGEPRGGPAATARAEAAAWHAVKAIEAVTAMQLGGGDLDDLLATVRAEATLAVELGEEQPAAAEPVLSPHVFRVGDKVHGDSDFLRAVGALPGNEVRHLGMGEFTVKTELGDVAFIRRDDAVSWPGKVGRAHLLAGSPEAIAGLLQQEAAASRRTAPTAPRTELSPARADTYAGPRWRYDRPLDAPLPPGRILGADGPALLFGHGTVEYPRQLRPFEIQDLVLLGQVVDGQLVGPVVDAIAVAKAAVRTILARLPDLDPRLRLVQVCRAFAADMGPRQMRDAVRLALEPGMPRGRPAAKLLGEIAAWHAVRAIEAVQSMQFGAVDLDALLAEARAAAALAVEKATASATPEQPPEPAADEGAAQERAARRRRTLRAALAAVEAPAALVPAAVVPAPVVPEERAARRTRLRRFVGDEER
jgi:hypothetical protein